MNFVTEPLQVDPFHLQLGVQVVVYRLIKPYTVTSKGVRQ